MEDLIDAWEDDYCIYEEYVEDDEYWDDDPPPLGFLSLGPVTIFCPMLEYDYCYASVPDHLSRLTLEQGEELVDFLVALDRICPDHEDCRDLTRDALHDELATQAQRRGDPAMAARQRARMAAYDLPDQVFEQLLLKLTAAE